MAEFKVAVSDPKDGRSYSVEVRGHHANSLVGKRIGDAVDGIFVGLPGYQLKIKGFILLLDYCTWVLLSKVQIYIL